jgi:hypothetical protein
MVRNSLEEDYLRVSEQFDQWLEALGYTVESPDNRLQALGQAVQDGHFPARWVDDYLRLHQLAHARNLDPPSRTVGHLLACTFDQAWEDWQQDRDEETQPEKPWRRIWRLLERGAR